MKANMNVLKTAVTAALLATLTGAVLPTNLAYGQSLEKLTVRFTWFSAGL